MNRNQLISIAICLPLLLILGGCTGKALKQENADLKLKMQQEQQTRQDYADKLRKNETRTKQDMAQHREEIARLRRDLNNSLQENQVVVGKLKDLTTLDMGYSVLFKPGRVELSEEGKAIAKQIAETFKKYPGYHMRIEGHTDNLPIHKKLKSRYFSNWELSAARAASVVRYMIFALKVPRHSLSLAGYADNRPIASNETAEGRAQNRRIRAVIFKI